MALEIHNTGRTLVDTVDPTSTSVSYVFEGTTVQIQVCTYWFNTTNQTLFFCTDNDGVTATWKQFTLTAV